MATASMKKKCGGAILMTDASEAGFAVCEAHVGPRIAEAIGSMDERWRFRRRDGAELAPRSAALAAGSDLADVRSILPLVAGDVIGEAVVDPWFPELPEQVVRTRLWKQLWQC